MFKVKLYDSCQTSQLELLSFGLNVKLYDSVQPAQSGVTSYVLPSLYMYSTSATWFSCFL